MVGADLTGANLTGADLTDANLTSANLTEANLFDADLAGADLERAEFARANLTKANLTDANVHGTGFADANLTGAKTTGWKTNFFTVFRGATWTDGRTCAFPSQGDCDGPDGWTITVVNDTNTVLKGMYGPFSNVKSLTKTIGSNGGTGTVIGSVVGDIDFRFVQGTRLYRDGVNVTVRRNGDGSGRLECKSDLFSAIKCDNTTINANTRTAELHIRYQPGMSD
ncbi:pentapeptide repeat-containing protein [Rhodococcus cerastii]|nr:pentapeptide repeat-containing protein [Rhodococcus cerastii]